MLTLEEVLADVAASPGFTNVNIVCVESRGADGNSPLHWMATLGDVVGTRLLLGADASIDAVNNKGNTPLHEAVVLRHWSLTCFLLEQGANRLLRNEAGQTPIDIAEADGFRPIIELLQKYREH